MGTLSASSGYYQIPAGYHRAGGGLNLAAIFRLYQERAAKGVTVGMPRWVFGRSRAGKTIFRYVFGHCMTEVLGLKMDEATKTIDPRLHRTERLHNRGKDTKRAIRNQLQWLAKVCVKNKRVKRKEKKGSWTYLLEQLKLLPGLKEHYKGKVGEAFRDIFPWAFDESNPNHLQDDDFPQAEMYAETSVVAWRLFDHIVRVDLGITFYNPPTREINCDLLPQNRGQFAKSRGYKNWEDLEESSGLLGFRRHCPVAGGVEGRRGSFGKLLKWYSPAAFDPGTKGFVMVEDFDDKEGSLRDEIAAQKAFLHIAAIHGIPEQEITARVTRQMLAEVSPGLLDEGETVLDLYQKAFARAIAEGRIDTALLYAQIETAGETARFRIRGTDFSFPAENLSRCSLARQEQPGEVIIYGRPQRLMIGKAFLQQLVPRFEIKLADPSTLLPYQLPPQLLRTAEGIVPKLEREVAEWQRRRSQVP